MMQAYFPAKVVSILGNYTCYFYSKRDDGKNAGSAKIVPSGYYGNLREVLDVVVENTEPGEFRDLLLRRFYRVEMLSRLSEPAVLKYTPEFLDEMCDAVEDVAKDFMDDGVHDGLGPVQRLRSTLLRNDDRQGLLRIARFAASVKAGARLDEFAWQPNGEIAVTVSGRLVHGDDKEPLRLLEREGRYFLHPDFTGGLMPEGELLDVTDDLDDFSAEISLRNRETAVEWPCPRPSPPRSRTSATVSAKSSCTVPAPFPRNASRAVAVSPRLLGRVGPAEGLGLVRKARLGADRAPQVDAACLPASLGSPARAVIPYFTEPHGNLTLDVARRGKKLAPYLADRPVLLVPGSRPELRLDLLTAPKTARSEVRLVLSSSGAAHTFPSTLVPTEGRAHLLLPALAGAPAGTWQLAAQLDGGNNAPLHLFEVSVDARGRIKLPVGLPLADRDLVNRVNSKHRKVTVRRALSAVGGPLARRLPSRARAKARRLANRIIG